MKTLFTSYPSEKLIMLMYTMRCSPGHEEQCVRLFKTMSDAQDYLRIVVGDRLVHAGISTEEIIHVERCE